MLEFPDDKSGCVGEGGVDGAYWSFLMTKVFFFFTVIVGFPEVGFSDDSSGFF